MTKGKAKVGERLPYLLGKLKAPRVLQRLEQTAERVRAEQWPYEQFLETQTLEDFDWTTQPAAEKPLVLHLAQLAWIEERANVCFFGPPGTGKTRLAIALGLKACQHGYRVAFATAQEWVSRLEQAQDRNQLEQELRRLERYHLLVVDEVGYLRSSARPPTCSSPWCRAATSAARSPSPPTARSSSGARSSATRWSPPP
jgi:chromosomal replication initiation ATPase DnaA